jgi:hypothetical protein
MILRIIETADTHLVDKSTQHTNEEECRAFLVIETL